MGSDNDHRRVVEISGRPEMVKKLNCPGDDSRAFSGGEIDIGSGADEIAEKSGVGSRYGSVEVSRPYRARA